jgi:hypothetical protein
VMPRPSEFRRSPRSIRALFSLPGFHLACCPRLSGPESLRNFLLTPLAFVVNRTKSNSCCGKCANVEISAAINSMSLAASAQPRR